jgi:hypothetical protein
MIMADFDKAILTPTAKALTRRIYDLESEWPNLLIDTDEDVRSVVAHVINSSKAFNEDLLQVQDLDLQIYVVSFSLAGFLKKMRVTDLIRVCEHFGFEVSFSVDVEATPRVTMSPEMQAIWNRSQEIVRSVNDFSWVNEPWTSEEEEVQVFLDSVSGKMPNCT